MEKKISLKVNLMHLANIVILMVLVEPMIFSLDSNLYRIDALYNYAMIMISFALIAYFLITKGKRIHIEPLVYISLIWCIQLFSTIIYAGNVKAAFMEYICVLLSALWFYHRLRVDYIGTVSCISWYLSLIVLINLILQIMYPNGFNVATWRGEASYWLFGNSNSSSIFIIAAITLQCVLYQEFNKIKYLLLAILSSVSLFLAGSSTGIVGLCVFIGLFILFVVKYANKTTYITPKLLNMRMYVVAVIVLTVLIVFLNNLSIFSYLIVNILGKDLTLTSRVSIWQRFTIAILEKPLLGYGFQHTSTIRQLFNTSHQHDYYLHILYQGGFISLFALFALINKCSKRLNESSNKKAYFISSGIFAIMIMFISECYSSISQVVVLYLVLMCALTVPYEASKKKLIEAKRG